jgi:hypothetical protein
MQIRRRMGRGLAVALAAVFALLSQTVVFALPAQAGETIEICTAHGSKTVMLDQSGAPAQPKQAPCPHCDSCLAAVQAAPDAAPVLVQPVRYGERVQQAAGRPFRFFQARGPPRPPGQGPPHILTV